MFEIPTTIELNGKEFNIRNKGDYRTILDCFAALEDAELDKQKGCSLVSLFFMRI